MLRKLIATAIRIYSDDEYEVATDFVSNLKEITSKSKNENEIAVEITDLAKLKNAEQPKTEDTPQYTDAEFSILNLLNAGAQFSLDLITFAEAKERVTALSATYMKEYATINNTFPHEVHAYLDN